jgi:hypothetical protein
MPVFSPYKIQKQKKKNKCQQDKVIVNHPALLDVHVRLNKKLRCLYLKRMRERNTDVF